MPYMYTNITFSRIRSPTVFCHFLSRPRLVEEICDLLFWYEEVTFRGISFIRNTCRTLAMQTFINMFETICQGFDLNQDVCIIIRSYFFAVIQIRWVWDFVPCARDSKTAKTCGVRQVSLSHPILFSIPENDNNFTWRVTGLITKTSQSSSKEEIASMLYDLQEPFSLTVVSIDWSSRLADSIGGLIDHSRN